MHSNAISRLDPFRFGIMIDIRQMRYFVAVAESRHFGRAADRLNVTQPPLSRQIAALERDLGVRLLERHSRQACLTHAGVRFLADCRSVLIAFDQACRNARLIDSGQIGELSVGFMMHAAYSSVPPLTRQFMAANPDVQLRLRETLPSALIEGIVNGEFDVAISFRSGPVRGLESRVIHRDRLCLAVPADHPLATTAEISAEVLFDEPLIASLPEVTPTLRVAIEDYFARAGKVPIFRLETQLQQTIVSLVAEGIGVGLVPSSLRRLNVAGVSFVEFANAPVVEQVLIWRAANLNPALPRFLAATDLAFNEEGRLD
jgi:DNA-binding transcriptional LysR family regulator